MAAAVSASKSSMDENAWLVRCCGQLYSPTGESHWVKWDSYLFLKGEEGKVADLPEASEDEAVDAIISAVVASRGAARWAPGLLEMPPLRVGNCLAR